MKKCLAVLLLFGVLCAAGVYFASQYFVQTPIYKVYKIYEVVSKADKTADDLGLTAEQRAILSDIRYMLLQQGVALNDGGGDIFEAFVTEFKKEQFNQPKMNSLVGKLMRRVQGIMPELFEKIAELHASLTPIQKNRLVNMLESSI
ncbi:MAG: hypothetical protein H6695_04045 [Deferribacteres bacterium]|nr:hypothetical protein [candidate division KSB1 bacterium]MCB9509323.1 hypothetical protein [Deferribacteres bacterium]